MIALHKHHKIASITIWVAHTLAAFLSLGGEGSIDRPGALLVYALLGLVPLACAVLMDPLHAQLRSERKQLVASEAEAERAAQESAKAQEHQRADHERRVAEIAKWEAAYKDAHGGQAPPAGYVPAMVSSAVDTRPASERTNTMAILALVFGLMGGWLGILFGHIALSQIKRTGERGEGMANAGLILGYLALVAGLILIALTLRNF